MKEDEVEQNSGSLYDVSPDFSPDFLGDNPDGGSAKDRLRESEDVASSEESGFYEGAKDKEHKDDKKDGGKEEKSGGISGGVGGTGGGGKPKLKGLSKAAIPIAVVVLILIIVFAVLIFLGQGSFANSFKDLEMEKHNTTVRGATL